MPTEDLSLLSTLVFTNSIVKLILPSQNMIFIILGWCASTGVKLQPKLLDDGIQGIFEECALS